MNDVKKTDNDSYDLQYLDAIDGHSKPVTLKDEMSWAPAMPGKDDAWEECAVAFVGESEFHDLALWTAAYILHGHGANVWMNPECAERDIFFIAVPKENRGKITDHNFVRAGWHGGHLPRERLTVEQHADKVVWSVEGQSYICRPPVWELKGHNHGVEFDLTYTQIGKPFWHWGPFEAAPKTGRAGYDLYASVTGAFKAGGQTFTIKKGYGIREHIITGGLNNPIRNLPAPRVMWWFYTIKDDVGINFFRPGIVDKGYVVIGGQEIDIDPANGKGTTSYQILEKWEDPRNGYNLPVRWHCSMASDEVVVDLDIKCHGRAFDHWTMKDGVRLYCYLLCTADGFLYQPSTGRKVEFKNHLTLNSFNRTIFTAGERFEGVVLSD